MPICIVRNFQGEYKEMLTSVNLQKRLFKFELRK